MNDTDTIDRPATELVDVAEVRDGQPVVAYTRTEAALADLRDRYEGATFDLTTTKGDKAARAARQELVALRTDLEKRRKQFKAPALEFGRLIDAEAKRITDAIQKLEDPIDAQIKKDEARREAERKERERIEAERRQRHLEAIAKIRNYVVMASGVPAERVQIGIERLQGMVFGDECEDFLANYQEARDETLDKLRQLHADKVQAQAEAARLEAQRAEQERRQRELDEQAADLRRREAEVAESIAAQGRGEEDKKIAQEALQVAAAPKVEPAPAPAAAPAAAPVAPPWQEPAPPAHPTLRLGVICDRLGFTMTASFVSDTLGVQPAATEKAAKLYTEAQFAEICRALVSHIGAMDELYAGA